MKFKKKQESKVDLTPFCPFLYLRFNDIAKKERISYDFPDDKNLKLKIIHKKKVIKQGRPLLLEVARTRLVLFQE